MNTTVATYSPQCYDQLMPWADKMAKSTIVPKEYRGNAGNIIAAVSMGAEIGLGPMQSINGIAVIQGSPTLGTDLQMSLVRKSKECEYIKETIVGEGEKMEAVCIVKRKGEEEVTRRFSVQDARLAELWGRNSWKGYPKRMLQIRARGFAFRDVFTDVLHGFTHSTEEMRDVAKDVERDVTPQKKEDVLLAPAEGENNEDGKDVYILDGVEYTAAEALEEVNAQIWEKSINIERFQEYKDWLKSNKLELQRLRLNHGKGNLVEHDRMYQELEEKFSKEAKDGQK